MSEIQDLIQNALDKDYNKANDVFGNSMTVKLNDLLDQERNKIASQIYDGVDPNEDDDEELDDDLVIDDADLEDIEAIEDDEVEESDDDEEDGEDIEYEDDTEEEEK